MEKMRIIENRTVDNDQYEKILKEDKKIIFINCEFHFEYNVKNNMCYQAITETFFLGDSYENDLTFIKCTFNLWNNIKRFCSDTKGYNYTNYNLIVCNIHIRGRNIIVLEDLMFINCDICSDNNTFSYIEMHNIHGIWVCTSSISINEFKVFESNLEIYGEKGIWISEINANDSQIFTKDDVDFGIKNLQDSIVDKEMLV